MGHNKANDNKSQANVVEDKKDNFVAVVTEVSMICNKIDWWVDRCVTKLLHDNKSQANVMTEVY